MTQEVVDTIRGKMCVLLCVAVFVSVFLCDDYIELLLRSWELSPVLISVSGWSSTNILNLVHKQLAPGTKPRIHFPKALDPLEPRETVEVGIMPSRPGSVSPTTSEVNHQALV